MIWVVVLMGKKILIDMISLELIIIVIIIIIIVMIVVSVVVNVICG